MPIVDLPASNAFATSAELAVHMRRTFTAEEHAAAEQALAIASDTIRGFTRQTISRVTNHVVVLRGTWESELELPERPVISVSSVKVNTVALTAGTWALTAGKLNRGRLPLVNGPDWDGPMVGNWGGPSTAIEVVYTHGFDPIPRDIAGVCMAVAARGLSVPPGITDEAAGGAGRPTISVSYSPEAFSLTDHERRILRTYKR